MYLFERSIFYCVPLFYYFAVSGVSSQCADGSWVTFKDEKCFKLMREDFVSKSEAAVICNSQTSNLLTVNSSDEQEFLTKWIFEDSEIADNVWIAASRVGNSSTEFVWDDGSALGFTNWDANSPSNDTARACIQLNSHLSKTEGTIKAPGDGLWSDVSCVKRNVVVCQTLQTLPVGEIQKILLETRARVLELENNPVPIGFIYVQLPNQSAPVALWPKVNWTDVSSEYAGLFFRAVGGTSNTFGSTQVESSPRLSAIEFVDNDALLNQGSHQTQFGIWSTALWTGWFFRHPDVSNDIIGMRFLVNGTANEVRPRNTAVRIWRRV